MPMKASLAAVAAECAAAAPLTPGKRPPSFAEVCATRVGDPASWDRLVSTVRVDEGRPTRPARLAVLRQQLELLLGPSADKLQLYVNSAVNTAAADLEAAYAIGVAVGRRVERDHQNHQTEGASER